MVKTRGIHSILVVWAVWLAAYCAPLRADDDWNQPTIVRPSVFFRERGKQGVVSIPDDCRSAYLNISLDLHEPSREATKDTSKQHGTISIFDPHDEFTTADATRISALLAAKYPEDTSVEVLPGGGESFIVLITREDGSRHIDKLPRYLHYQNLARARHALKREAEIVRLIGEAFGEAGKRSVVSVRSQDTESIIPSLSLDYANGGSLNSQLKTLGPTADFVLLADIFAATAKPLGYVHALKETHNDVKPHNYLVELSDGKIVAVRLADFGFSSPAGKTASGFTPSYSRPLLFRGKTTAKDLHEASVQNDMYAHMITLQEILLGKTITQMWKEESPHVYRAKVGERKTKNGLKAVKAPLLKKSPHSIDPRIPEVLSTISWVEFKNIEDMQAMLARARETQGDPNRFYRKYFGPQVLAKMTPEDAARLIATDDALKSRLNKFTLRGNALGLSYRAWWKIRRLVRAQ